MDLISDLPDPIVHHIMSFLTTLDVTKLSILSKRFFSLWGSFPVIDIDQSRFARGYRGNPASMTAAFLQHVVNSVMHRTNDTTLLSEFRVKACLQGMLTDQGFDMAILRVVAYGVKCMELNLGFDDHYLLPIDQFASGSCINVLKLKGLQLDVNKLIQVCPCLTTLCLTSCLIVPPYIKFSSKTLTEFEVRFCDVRCVKINAPNLHSFVFDSSHEVTAVDNQHEHWPPALAKPCEIDALKCENIVYLSLKNLVSGRDWIEELVFRLKKLKTFILIGCHDIEHITVWNDELERVKIGRCPRLSSIEVKATSLESFAYKKSTWDRDCSFTFTTSKHIKDLSIKGATINDQWLEDQLANMTHLERLRLEGCNVLRKIEVIHEKLQRLELYRCIGLVEADIDTPSLVCFVYHGKVIDFVKMVTQSSCIATLCMQPWDTSDNDSLFRWRNLLSFFGHCKALKLICNNKKEVMMPEMHREKLVSPLYDLQHFEIKIKSSAKIDRDLVDGLLWFAPLPKSLHISSNPQKPLQMIIKFEYSDMIEGREDKNQFCCETKLIKCWKHHLETLEIESSGASLEESTELQKYFVTNAKIQIRFVSV
ncbi:hypothetical protein QVD17_03757 [Tagetes erecta]|uniref:F-box domain-containing protein n=1 Tax=Tagetes erecta TaxID=13708 RepID=A0AAD8PA78_TARER|nr:hypothetical protein QVD17_03757 [Tagetes erecta]